MNIELENQKLTLNPNYSPLTTNNTNIISSTNDMLIQRVINMKTMMGKLTEERYEELLRERKTKEQQINKLIPKIKHD